MMSGVTVRGTHVHVHRPQLAVTMFFPTSQWHEQRECPCLFTVSGTKEINERSLPKHKKKYIKIIYCSVSYQQIVQETNKKQTNLGHQ